MEVQPDQGNKRKQLFGIVPGMDGLDVVSPHLPAGKKFARFGLV